MLNSLESALVRIRALQAGIPEIAANSGLPVAGILGDVMPSEILRASGILPLKVPSAVFSGLPVDGKAPVDLYEWLIVPEYMKEFVQSSFQTKNIIALPAIHGYGEQAAEAIHARINMALSAMGAGEALGVSLDSLRRSVGEFNEIRRAVRGISLLRLERNSELGNAALQEIFESALTVPSERIRPELLKILDILNGIPPVETSLPRVMIAGGYCGCWSLIDEIERDSCLVTEDDLADGRRQFDITLDESSDYLHFELLNAYSYKAFPFGVRAARERFELVYSQLKNYGIEAVVFLADSLCGPRGEELEYLRARLMRAGIDPIIARSADAAAVTAEYLREVHRSA
ncbi:MAG: 2-hydroxyacyl-CoA dehydratase [Spirochaetes bacterium]|nr:MAG: 2-hydroxyacyl-CoA dehydratase [Spirochaetota bacterium]